MLKTLFSIILVIFCLNAKAQQIVTDTNFTRPIYIDASIGIGNLVFADINLGIKLNKKNAIGLSYLGFIEQTDEFIPASGLGIQYSTKPLKWFLLKLESGIITGSSKPYSGTRSSIYNNEKSGNIYFRTTTAVRIVQGLYLGLTIVIAPNSVFDNSFYNSYNPISPDQLQTTETIKTFVLSLGINSAPKFKRK